MKVLLLTLCLAAATNTSFCNSNTDFTPDTTIYCGGDCGGCSGGCPTDDSDSDDNG